MMFMTEVRPYAWNPITGQAPKATKKAHNAYDAAPQTNAAAFTPRVSLSETQDAFWIRAEVPGITTEQLELSFEKDELTIKGEKPREVLENNEARWLHDERTFGRFERTFRFTTSVDADSIQAETRDGILTVRVAKAKSALPKKITVISKA